MTPRPAERGETLVELLVTIAILGITFVGVLSGLGTAALGSDIHRKEATAEVVLRNLAETLADPGVPYVPCATPSSYPTSALVVPTGYEASVTAVAFWDSNGFPTTTTPATFSSTAPATCPLTDTGVQRLTLRVRSNDDRAVEVVDVYKRVS